MKKLYFFVLLCFFNFYLGYSQVVFVLHNAGGVMEKGTNRVYQTGDKLNMESTIVLKDSSSHLILLTPLRDKYYIKYGKGKSLEGLAKSFLTVEPVVPVVNTKSSQYKFTSANDLKAFFKQNNSVAVLKERKFYVSAKEYTIDNTHEFALQITVNGEKVLKPLPYVDGAVVLSKKDLQSIFTDKIGPEVYLQSELVYCTKADKKVQVQSIASFRLFVPFSDDIKNKISLIHEVFQQNEENIAIHIKRILYEAYGEIDPEDAKLFGLNI